MNVLLSRARWKLVVIGSLDFLRNRFPTGKVVASDAPMAFLKRMLETIDSMSESGDDEKGAGASVVSIERLLGNRS